jgi:hypothetical protein
VIGVALLFVSGCSSGGSDENEADATRGSNDRPPDDATTEPSIEDPFDDDDPDELLDRSACDIFSKEDIEGMTRFPSTTFKVVDTLDEPPVPGDVVYSQRSRCGFNAESRDQQGGVSGGSGSWAYLTLTNDLRAFAPDPSWPEYEAVKGVGDDAYWTDGGFTLVVKTGHYVVEIESSVGLSSDEYPDVIEGRQQLILALADLVLPRL